MSKINRLHNRIQCYYYLQMDNKHTAESGHFQSDNNIMVDFNLEVVNFKTNTKQCVRYTNSVDFGFEQECIF